jgi:hypothetical protein
VFFARGARSETTRRLRSTGLSRDACRACRVSSETLDYTISELAAKRFDDDRHRALFRRVREQGSVNFAS